MEEIAIIINLHASVFYKAKLLLYLQCKRANNSYHILVLHVIIFIATFCNIYWKVSEKGQCNVNLLIKNITGMQLIADH